MSSHPFGTDDTLAGVTGREHPATAPHGEHELERGATVDRYMVLGKIGAGGMGVVYAAYDPELDRKVALKLLRPLADDGSVIAGRARLLREAQALAKLSHPNVVAVYDAGTHGDGVWVAMELVTGSTLGVWAVVQPRRWSDVLRVLTEVARGVGAAHNAGLVHRDLKPDNVMIGSDGRVRVMDFGLAHGRSAAATDIDLAVTVGSDSIARPEMAALALRLTQVGALQGTPAYMAPEQWQGQEVKAAADQFGWSVMAWELLYGERPFAGETMMALAANVLSGLRRVPTKGRGVPSWLRKVIERGLAPDPLQRWPSMEALLGALTRTTARTQIWLTVMVVTCIAALAAAASYRFAPRQDVVSLSCRDVPVKSEDLWGPDEKLGVERALMATGVDYAQDVWARLDHHFDGYAAAWAAQHRAACEAHITGTESSRLLDLRNACLGQRRSRASQLIELLTHADAVAAENAVQAATTLPSMNDCLDAEVLLAEVPPPADPSTAARIDGLRERLGRASALVATGQYKEGLRLAGEIRVEATNAGYAPFEAEAALVEGSVLFLAAQPAKAEGALSRAVELALAHDMHVIAAEAAVKLIFVLGSASNLGRPAEALVIRPFAEALVARSDTDGRLAALLNNNLGAVFEAAGDPTQARTHYERSLDLLQRASASEDPILVYVYHNLGSMYLDAGRLAEAREHYNRASERCEEMLGQRHPLRAHPIAGLGDIDMREGKYEEALRNYGTSLDIMETSYGFDHLYLLPPLIGMGNVYMSIGRYDAARAYFERVVRIADKPGTEHPLLADALTGLANLASIEGDLSEAEALSQRAASISTASGSPKQDPSTTSHFD